MIKTDIYIGLNDRITKEQKFNTGRYIEVLKMVCRNYQVPFSFNLVQEDICMDPENIQRKIHWSSH